MIYHFSRKFIEEKGITYCLNHAVNETIERRKARLNRIESDKSDMKVTVEIEEIEPEERL